MQTIKRFAITLSLTVFLLGCDSSDTTQTQAVVAESVVTSPILDEAKILETVELVPVRKYDLEDGHGYYVQESPDVSIEFRSSPERINVSLMTYPEAEFKDKNSVAKNMATKLLSVITGTDGKLIDGALSGKIESGKSTINGLPVNISIVGENSLLVTISK